MQFDLEQEAETLRGERAYLEGDRSARTLVKSDWFRLVLVALRPAAVFDEADQRGVVCVQVLEGSLQLRAGDTSSEVEVGSLAVVGPGQAWSARTTRETLMLLQLSWPPEPGSLA
jgi:quercetin dioxygenase-like cupin family protein